MYGAATEHTSRYRARSTRSRSTVLAIYLTALGLTDTTADRTFGHIAGRTTWNHTHADGNNHWNDSEAGLDAGSNSQAGHSHTRSAPGKHDRIALGRTEDDHLWQNSPRGIE